MPGICLRISIFHRGSKDYRLPETDGIGAFHALQQYAPAAAGDPLKLGLTQTTGSMNDSSSQRDCAVSDPLTEN